MGYTSNCPPPNDAPRVNAELVLKLRNIYSAEYHCLRRIPELLNRIPKTKLHPLLSDHLHTIVERKLIIESIFQEIGLKASGAVCMTFKKLISRAANAIYQTKTHETRDPYALLHTLVEISIYRSSIYNYLQKALISLENPSISTALKRCLVEEDNFFYSLLNLKEELSQVQPSSHDPVLSIN